MPLIVVIMGVAGSGKTTIGSSLAGQLHCAFLDGDVLHSAANVQKMARGEPLSDSDRLPWLAAIHARMLDAFRRGDDLVVACSALKQSYRDVLAEGIAVAWIYLRGSPQLIVSRLEHRSNHFMKADMLAAQFDSLEEPRDAMVVDIAQSPAAIVDEILARLHHDK